MIGFVYAIECGDAVKVGFARDPVRRLSELNVGSPGRHRLIGYARGSKKHEMEFHAIAQSEKIRGEWFRRGPIVTHFLSLLPSYEPHAPRQIGSSQKIASGEALKKYLVQNEISQQSFAVLVGSTQAAVAYWTNGQRMPRPEQMRRIVSATNGEVTPSDFFTT